MIKPRLNIFDAPLIEVIAEANNPPVQDSATDILIFFLFDCIVKLKAITEIKEVSAKVLMGKAVLFIAAYK